MAEIVLTLKGGKDYDAPWLVIHAASFEELHGLFVAGGYLDSYQHATQAILEANQLANVKATLGATETGNMPTPPVQAGTDPLQQPANATLIAVAAKKSGKSKEELKGISKAEAQRLIQGGS
jgi:hypothetical protein